MSNSAPAHYEYDHEHGDIHKVPVIMMGAVMAISVALTASVSLGWFDRVAVPSEVRADAGVQPTASRQLNFYDAEEGAVSIVDASTGTEIARYEAGTGGFIRSTVRSLAQARQVRGIGAQPPFDLTQWDDGSLSLIDSTTGKSVELGSFGATNRAVFAALLERDQS